MRAVPTLLRGSVPEASMRSEPSMPTGRHMKSQTVKWKSVSTRDWASASSRARVAISPGCRGTVPSARTPAGTGSPAVLQRPSSQRGARADDAGVRVAVVDAVADEVRGGVTPAGLGMAERSEKRPLSRLYIGPCGGRMPQRLRICW